MLRDLTARLRQAPHWSGISYPVLDLVLHLHDRDDAARLGAARHARRLARRGGRRGRRDRRRHLHAPRPRRQLRLGRAHRSRLAAPGLPDLPGGGRRCASGSDARANWAQRRSPLRIRTAASMTGSLLVILLVLVVEGARGEPSARGDRARLRRHRAAARPRLDAPDLVRPRVGAARSAHRRLRRAAPARPAPPAHRGRAAVRRAVRARADARPAAARGRGARPARRHRARARPRRAARRRAGSPSCSPASRRPVRPRRPSGCARASGPRATRRRRRLAAAATRRPTSSPGRSSFSTPRRSWAATTRAGRRPDVLVYGHPRLGVTAFSQLLELAAAIDARYRIAPAHSRKVARLAQ